MIMKLITFKLLIVFSCFANATVSDSANNFILDSAEGKVSLSDFSNKVVMLYFGYTSCPDICPTSLARISSAYRSLTKEEQTQIQPILISLDPERDSKDKLADYTKFFLPGMIGLTGTEDEIAAVAKKYKISYRKTEVENGLGYVVDHSSIYFIIGRDGQLFSHLLHDVRPDEIAESLKNALLVPQKNILSKQNIIYSKPSIRVTPPGQNITAAYVSLKNTSKADITLLGASSDSAQSVEIHEHKMSEGMMNMRQVEHIHIPSQKTVKLQPGGYHLMVFGLNKSIVENDEIKITLNFKNNLSQEILFKAEKAY